MLAPGLLTTVQDLGRPGFEAEGVARGGAADPVSLRVANRLVGNPDEAAALEMTLVGGAYRFDGRTVAGIAGSDLDACWERAPGGRVPLRPWSAIRIEAGDILRFGSTRDGARAYLAVPGGIAVPRVLGSASTHLPSGIGGHLGRALRKGDVLEAAGAGGTLREVDSGPLREIVFRTTLRFVDGPQHDWFDAEAKGALAAGVFLVEESSDRTGVRLSGPWPSVRSSLSMWTEGVLPGQIQVTPDGRGIVLGVDGPTTGGYPKIASVLAADLSALGQLRPRDRVRFAPVDLAAAREAIVDCERRIDAAFGGTIRP